MFSFFKKKEKEYKDVEFNIFRYKTPKLNIGNNIIGDNSKLIRLKDIISMEISDMCELNDDGLIGHSYKFVNEILDKPLECRYGYAVTYNSGVNFFSTIEDCLKYFIGQIDIYMHDFGKYSTNDIVSLIKYIDVPLILELMEERYIPIFTNDNYDIFKDSEMYMWGYKSIGMSGCFPKLPSIKYGSFYIDIKGRIVHSISEELLTIDTITTKTSIYKSHDNYPSQFFECNNSVFYKDDVVQYTNYKEYLRLNKSVMRDRKIESILN